MSSVVEEQIRDSDSHSFPHPLFDNKVTVVSKSGTGEEFCEFVDGLKHGEWSRWFDKWRKSGSGKYVDGQRHGKFMFWYKSGLLASECTYVKGNLHGIVRNWYESGALKEERRYRHGKLHGESILWFDVCPENLELEGMKSRTFYVLGKKHGTENIWHQNGALCSNIVYEMGKQVVPR